MIEYNHKGKGEPDMNRTEDSPVADWITKPAYTESEALAKFEWWCVNHGSKYAYASVCLREQALIPTKKRVALLIQYQHVNAPAATPANRSSGAIAWLDANAYQIVTTRELAAALGVTQGVARRLIRDLPHYFKRVNQYKYEVRNYRGERALDKAQV
jgi:hypothetical protein